MALSDTSNLVRIRGHQGPHPAEYHKAVFARLNDATARCGSIAACRGALERELARIARDLVRDGSKLRKLILKGAEE